MVLAVALLGARGALAQLPGLPGVPGVPSFLDKPKSATVAPAAAPKGLSALRTHARDGLAQAHAQLKAFEKAALSPGTTNAQAEARRRLLRDLIIIYERQLQNIGNLEERQAAHKRTKAQAERWAGFQNKPPYPIQMLDELRARRAAIRQRLKSIDASRTPLLKNELDRLKGRSRDAEAEARAVVDELQRATTENARQQARWQERSAKLRAKTALEMAKVIGITIQATHEEGLADRVALGLIDRQVEVAEKGVRFDEAELRTVKTALQAQMVALEGAQQDQLRRGKQRAVARDRAIAALERAPSAGTDATLAEAKLRAAETWVATLRIEGTVLLTSVAAVRAVLDAWGDRFVAMNDADAERRRAARDRLRFARDRMKAWAEFASNEVRIAGADEQKQLARFEALAADAPQRKSEQTALDAVQRRALAIGRFDADVARAATELDRWLEGFVEARKERSVGERLTDHTATASAIAQRIWNFEIFSVEDSVVIGGQTLTTTRSITVRKITNALLVFVIGLWLAVIVVRRFEAFVVRRFGYDAPLARTLSHWLLAAVGGILLLISFSVAQIPLTAFAFVGGALAIGVGFGTQTIIKNFISGILLLTERKVKVGDIVEAEGIVGTVMVIDLRASTILGFDGVETVVPNALLLENKVSNWTHTNNRLRRIVRVGVAYGSPVRGVEKLLRSCVDDHPEVLKFPAPLVLFEDFGDNGLIFSTWFWIAMRRDTISVGIMSDLRFLIEERLREAGIVVAFPQRDIHLDTTKPLQIELLQADNGAGARQ